MSIKRKNTIAASLMKQGKELDLEAMKRQVELLHGGAAQPATEKQDDAPPVEPPAPVRIVRLSVDAPEEVYLALKSKVLRDRSNIKEYVLSLLKKDLGF